MANKKAKRKYDKQRYEKRNVMGNDSPTHTDTDSFAGATTSVPVHPNTTEGSIAYNLNFPLLYICSSSNTRHSCC